MCVVAVRFLAEFAKAARKTDRVMAAPLPCDHGFSPSIWSTSHTSFAVWVRTVACAVTLGACGDSLLSGFIGLGESLRFWVSASLFHLFLPCAAATDLRVACELFHCSVLLALLNEAARSSVRPGGEPPNPSGEIGSLPTLLARSGSPTAGPRVTSSGPIRSQLGMLFSRVFSEVALSQTSPSHSCLYEAALLLLDTLSVLRVVRLRALVTVFCSPFEVEKCYALQARTEAFLKDSSNPMLPLLSVDVDYLTLSEACLKLGRPMTAVFHTELWCCSSFGRPSLRPEAIPAAFSRALEEPFLQLDGSSKQEQLLLKAHCLLSDPDGPTGVVSTASTVDVRTQVAAHAGDALTSLVLASSLTTNGAAAAEPELGSMMNVRVVPYMSCMLTRSRPILRARRLVTLKMLRGLCKCLAHTLRCMRTCSPWMQA